MFVALLLLLSEAVAHRVDYVSPVCAELVEKQVPGEPELKPVTSLEDVLFFFGLKTTPEAVQFVEDLALPHDPLVGRAAKLLLQDWDGGVVDDVEDRFLFVTTTLDLVQKILLAPRGNDPEGATLHSLYVRYGNLLGATEYLHRDAPVIDVLYEVLVGIGTANEAPVERSPLASLSELISNPQTLPGLNPYQLEYLGLEEISSLNSISHALKERLWPRASLLEAVLRAANTVRENPGRPQLATPLIGTLKLLIAEIGELPQAMEAMLSFRRSQEKMRAELKALSRITKDFNGLKKMASIEEKILELESQVRAIEQPYQWHYQPMDDQQIQYALELRQKQKLDLIDLHSDLMKHTDPASRQQIADEVLYLVGDMGLQK